MCVDGKIISADGSSWATPVEEVVIIRFCGRNCDEYLDSSQELHTRTTKDSGNLLQDIRTVAKRGRSFVGG